MPELPIRKTFSQVEEVRQAAGATDTGGPLRKVAVCAVCTNPLAGQGYVADLSPLIEPSGKIGSFLGAEAARLLGEPVESYGKGGLAGTAGEQEHVNAALTSVFGDAFRQAIGGGTAWITSATKVCAPGAVVDVPLAFKDEIWVRSHYDAMEVRIPDAPLPEEIVIIAAVANRGRINARVGGLSVDEARAGGSS
ncbi:amino acid synthesis family protein [Actinobacteria bacterium YIM 96077]|uniref:Amino acid synthesis family protein n=1 Tax=Phytoactinopolyspora halophila TaxID=1981511 RepID=A0A329QXU6_9ACTN|nr:amino acid synthesis family protein [Phytoactinopolyspora halophila]AYY14991.1 amino acid synthesis family protein [Actinobacteria bacterium YIM 96077]RAW15448.1 amino acid synthesis family protein [Phytoactinopolyspora halophila]